MFKKILIANRGEIAVRIIRTCREMGILTLALFEPADRDCLHVRLADECVDLEGPDAFFDIDHIVRIAHENGADAIHPGYGFLAERSDFIRACDDDGIVFIGPPAGVVAQAEYKIGTLQRVSAVGYPTVMHSNRSFQETEMDALRAAAGNLGYPLVVKSCRGGRGRGEQLVKRPGALAEAVRRAQVESHAVYGDRYVYLEKAILPAHQVGVQVIAGPDGRVIHLGEREGSALIRNQKVIEEAPAPCLSPDQREQIWAAAVDIARLLDYQNVGTVEFLVDEHGRFYFSEVKARLQVEHALTEIMTGVDLVREQIRIAAGEELGYEQQSIDRRGWAILARVRAENPWNHYMPSSGRLNHVRFPGGHGIRVDSAIYCQADVPSTYDPLIAKITAWAEDRPGAIHRLHSALEDCKLVGTHTNLSLLQQVLQSAEFNLGRYDTDLMRNPIDQPYPFNDMAFSGQHLRDMAAIAAVLYVLRNQQMTRPEMPSRFVSGWHQNSRRLPR